jgi:hypothetical protein
MSVESLLVKDDERMKLIQSLVDHVRAVVGDAAEDYQERLYLEYKVGAKLLAGVLEHLDQEVLKRDLLRANKPAPS